MLPLRLLSLVRSPPGGWLSSVADLPSSSGAVLPPATDFLAGDFVFVGDRLFLEAEPLVLLEGDLGVVFIGDFRDELLGDFLVEETPNEGDL